MEVTSPPQPIRLPLSPAWLVFAALVLFVPVSALLFTRTAAPPLPVLAELPQFKLTDEHGRSFGRADMDGRVWIADFVFTSCADACPRLTQKLRSVQDRLVPLEQGGNIGLLSISVDPERDTPAKLLQYAQSFGARDGLWHFLTGPQTEVERTVVKGFHMAMAKMPLPRDPVDPHLEAFDIMHGEKLVLVDRRGQIRGYYDADDADKLLRDARLLTGGGRG